jgi:hypothetical protein
VFPIPLQVPAFPAQLAISLDLNLNALNAHLEVSLPIMVQRSAHLAQLVSSNVFTYLFLLR